MQRGADWGGGTHRGDPVPGAPLRRDGFRLDRTITITNILTSVGLIIGILSWGNGVQDNVAANTSDIAYLNERQSRTELRVEAVRTELRGDLQKIMEKIDQIYINTSYLSRERPFYPPQPEVASP